VNYLGNPRIELDRRRLLIRGARLPEGERDITIPLDSKGRMMLDWPPEDYKDSYHHISFEDFSLLDDVEAELEQYGRALLSADIPFFAQFDSSLSRIPFIASDLAALFDAAAEAKAAALENTSGEFFDAYTEYRAQSRGLIREILDLDPAAKVRAQVSRFEGDAAAAAGDEAEYIATLAEYLAVDLDRYEKLSGHIEELVKDRFCILGRVDTGTTDIGVNPFWGEYVNVGTHAVVLDTILSQSFITPLPVLWSILLILLVPLFLLASAPLAPTFRAVLGFAAAVFMFLFSALLFRFSGVFLGPLGPVLAMGAAVTAREILSYRSAEQEKSFYRKAFATYTSEAVADEIAKNPELLQLGGTRRRMSAVFTDIQGFSTISEQLGPEDLVRLLNRYLTVMSDIVLGEEGTIDKYEGDAIIAFFGAPLEQPDNALRACLSAVKMKRAEAELNKVVVAEGLSPRPLFTRIGINSGDMVAGNMGTDKKMNYTIMGDAVNLAARLEGVNKQYGTWILASEDTILETEGRILTRRLDKVRVVGKSEPVRLHNILNVLDEASEEEQKLVQVFHGAMDYFENRNWKEAAAGFRDVLNMEPSGPAGIYIRRCEQYLEKAPEDAWDGVFNLTEK
jgi:adenylate cyclase